MRSNLPLIIFILVFTLLHASAQATAGAIVPPPQEVRLAVPHVDLPLGGTFAVELSNASTAMSNTGRFVAAELTAAGFAERAATTGHLVVRFQHLRASEPLPAGGLPTNFAEFPAMGTEGYLVIVTRSTTGARITIGAKTDEGLFRGATTVRQLVTASATTRATSVAVQEIRDYPDLPMRVAFLLPNLTYADGAWTVAPGATAALDALARLKYDTVVVDLDPPLGSSSWPSFHTALNALRAHSSQRYIELVPRLGNLQSQGLHEWRDGWWVKDEPFRFGANDVAVADQTTGYSVANRVLNGGFEAAIDQGLGTAGPAGARSGNWYSQGSSAPLLARDCTVRRSGTCSLRITASGSGTRTVRQWIPGNHPAGHYLVTLYLKTTGVVPVTEEDRDGPGLLVGFHSGSTPVGLAKAARVAASSPSRDWGRHAFVVRVPRGSTANQLLLEVSAPAGSGAAWIDDVDVRRIDGDLKNVLVKAYPLRVTSTTGVLYEQGTDYTLLPGALKPSYVDGPTSATIKRIATGRIPVGSAVRISYDKGLFPEVETPWGDSTARVGHSNEESMNLCGSALFEQLYAPTLNHLLDDPAVNALWLVSDELRGMNRSGACHDASGNPLASNGEALAGFIDRVIQLARSRRPGIRLYMWDDTVSPTHSGGMPSYQVDRGQPGRYDFGGRPGATFCTLDPSAPMCAADRVTTDVGPELQLFTWLNSPQTLFQKNGALRFFDARGHRALVTATTLGQSCADAQRSVHDFAAIAGSVPSVIGILRDKWDSDSGCNPTTLKASLGWNLEHEQVLYEPFEFQLPNQSPDVYFKTDRGLSAYGLSGATWTSDGTCIDRYQGWRRVYTEASLPVNAGGICISPTGGSVLLPTLWVDSSVAYRFALDAVADPAVSGTVRFLWTDSAGANRTQDFPVSLGGNGKSSKRVEVEAPVTPPGAVPGSKLRIQVLASKAAKLDNFMIWRSRPGCPYGAVYSEAPTVTVPVADGAQTFEVRVRFRNEKGCAELRVEGMTSTDGYTSPTTFPVVAMGRDLVWREVVVRGTAPAVGSSRTVNLRRAGTANPPIPIVLQFVSGSNAPPGTLGAPGTPTVTSNQ